MGGQKDQKGHGQRGIQTGRGGGTAGDKAVGVTDENENYDRGREGKNEAPMGAHDGVLEGGDGVDYGLGHVLNPARDQGQFGRGQPGQNYHDQHKKPGIDQIIILVGEMAQADFFQKPNQ